MVEYQFPCRQTVIIQDSVARRTRRNGRFILIPVRRFRQYRNADRCLLTSQVHRLRVGRQRFDYPFPFYPILPANCQKELLSNIQKVLRHGIQEIFRFRNGRVERQRSPRNYSEFLRRRDGIRQSISVETISRERSEAEAAIKSMRDEYTQTSQRLALAQASYDQIKSTLSKLI